MLKPVVNDEKVEGALPPQVVRFLGAKDGDVIVFQSLPNEGPGIFKVIVKRKKSK